MCVSYIEIAYSFRTMDTSKKFAYRLEAGIVTGDAMGVMSVADLNYTKKIFLER